MESSTKRRYSINDDVTAALSKLIESPGSTKGLFIERERERDPNRLAQLNSIYERVKELANSINKVYRIDYCI